MIHLTFRSRVQSRTRASEKRPARTCEKLVRAYQEKSCTLDLLRDIDSICRASYRMHEMNFLCSSAGFTSNTTRDFSTVVLMSYALSTIALSLWK